MAKASCACGALKLETHAEPYATVICHCRECQKRSGSPFGAGVYFNKRDVTLPDGAATFARPAGEGRKLTNHFCPRCGATLYWFTELHPDGVAVALGAFGDPSAFTPQRSVWEQSRHPWVTLPAEIPGLLQGRGSTPSR